jgi:single-strand DNA-binding protein
MPNLNRVLLIGTLTKDPEIHRTNRGTSVGEISLAINRVVVAEGERREEVLFIGVTLWGRLAEVAEQFLKKGRSVFIEGRLQLDTWLEKDSGQKRSRLKVVGENLQLLGSRAESEGGDAPTANRPSSGRRPQSLEDFEPGQEVPF